MPIEIFYQFFDDAIIEMVVCETNQYANQFFEAKQLCRTRLKDTTKNEIKTFIGVIMSYFVYCGKSKDSLVHGLDHPGSLLVIKLAETCLMQEDFW